MKDKNLTHRLKITAIASTTFFFLTTPALAMDFDPEVPLEIDSTLYAETQGVSIEEAMSRLSRQAEIGELDEILMLEHQENYAGLYIEHSPVYKIKVLFKNLRGKDNKNFTGALNRRLAKTSWRSFVKIRKVNHSLEELNNTQTSLGSQLATLDVDSELDINLQNNSVVIYTLDL